MTTKLTHDTERWLRSNAELYRRKGNQQMARNFEMCAEDVKTLRARVARLEEALISTMTALRTCGNFPRIEEEYRRALEEK